MPEVANPPLFLLLPAFATCIPFAWTVWVVWRAKAPAPFAGVMTAGILLHGAAWHLSTLLPQPYDAMLEDAKGALMGFHLAFLVTFLMAAFEELSMDRACALACAVMLSMLVDSYSARDLPSVLTCGFDPACWELAYECRPKLFLAPSQVAVETGESAREPVGGMKVDTPFGDGYVLSTRGDGQKVVESGKWQLAYSCAPRMFLDAKLVTKVM